MHAVKALGSVGAREAVPDLLLLLDGPVAADAAQALALIRDKRSLEALQAYLARPSDVLPGFVYALNQDYNPDFRRDIKGKRLGQNISGPADEVILKVGETFGVPVIWHSPPPSDTHQKVTTTEVYSSEDFDTSIGRPLYYRNREQRYYAVIRGNELHIVNSKEATKFISDIFAQDFK